MSQREEATRVVAREDLLSKLRSLTRKRTGRVRHTVGSMLQDSDVEDALLSALGSGYYRALLVKFTEIAELTPDWWQVQRRAHGLHGKNRINDLGIILEHYPEFSDFVVPLTDDEILDAAQKEFRDFIAGIGTDYHQFERQRRAAVNFYLFENPRPRRDDFYIVPGSVGEAVMQDAKTETFDITDPNSHARVEDVIKFKMLEDESNPLGPFVTRAATLALQEYGPSGLFWLVEALFLPSRYTEVLRALAGTEEEIGAQEFERVKRDMVRKLPAIHTRMIGMLQQDPDMAALVELLDAHTPARPAHMHSFTTPPIVDKEKRRYMERQVPRLVGRLESDHENGLIYYFGTLSEPAKREVLFEFSKVSDHDDWSRFKRRLTRLAGTHQRAS